MITTFSKSDNSLLRDIVHETDINVVPDNIFNGVTYIMTDERIDLELHVTTKSFFILLYFC